MTELRKCFSLDNEEFKYDSFGEMLESMDEEPTVGRVYFEADCETLTALDAARHVDAGYLIEQMESSLYDEIGDCAMEVFSGVTPEARLELDAFLLAWVEKNSDISRYWKIVGKSRECQITEGDLE